MTMVSDTKHVHVFMIITYINININKELKRLSFSLYPKAGPVPEASGALLSLGLDMLIE